MLDSSKLEDPEGDAGPVGDTPPLRLDNIQIVVSTVTTVEDPDISGVLESLTVELDTEQAARFEELAEEAYARWETEAKDLLALRLTEAYREALDAG